MVSPARTATRTRQSSGVGSSTVAAKRCTASTAPIFGTVVTSAATGVRAPSVTSGTQKCTGTAPALNSGPASSNSAATAVTATDAPGSVPARAEYPVAPPSPNRTVTPTSMVTPMSAPIR